MEYQKIAVKNVVVINVCLGIEGKMFNEGRIILDIDTYDFAGRLTDDIILGFYKDGRYTICYYYKTFGTDVLPQIYYEDSEDEDVMYEYQEYKFILIVPFQKNDVVDDFSQRRMKFEEYGILISFEDFETDVHEIERCIKNNSDLIEQRD